MNDEAGYRMGERGRKEEANLALPTDMFARPKE